MWEETLCYICVFDLRERLWASNVLNKNTPSNIFSVSVMDAWGKWTEVSDKVIMAADGNGDFVKATGLWQGKESGKTSFCAVELVRAKQDARAHSNLPLFFLPFRLDLTKVGMGAVRSKRFAMVVDDLKVTYIGVETQYVLLIPPSWLCCES